MVAKKGRPVSENPKDYMLRVRMDEQTLQQLDECCEAENLSRSEVVRKGIQEQHSKLKKEGVGDPLKYTNTLNHQRFPNWINPFYHSWELLSSEN